MSFDPDDPRFTAYALGELDPESREAVEATLRDDPKALAFVQGVEETARLLADEFRHESTTTPGLDPARRDTIEERLTSATGPATIPIASAPRRPWLPLLVPLAAVAGIIGLAVVLTLPSYRAARRAPVQVAWNEKEVPAPESAAAVAKSMPAGPEAARLFGLGVDYAEKLGEARDAQPKGAARPDDLALRVTPAETVSANSYEPSARGNLPAPAAVALDSSRIAGGLPAAPAASPAPPVSLQATLAEQSRIEAVRRQEFASAAFKNRAGGRDMVGMGGLGGGMGRGDMPAGGPAAPGGSVPGVTTMNGASALVAKAEDALHFDGSRPEPALPGGSPAQDRKVNPTRDHTLGSRPPVVVGAQGGDIANFTGTLNIPFGQSSGPIAPSNAVPNIYQQEARMKPAQNAGSDLSYFDAKKTNVAANMPGLQQVGQGQPGGGQANAGQGAEKAPANPAGMTLPSGKYMRDDVQYFSDPSKPGQQATANYALAPNPPGQAGKPATNSPGEFRQTKGYESESLASSHRFGAMQAPLGANKPGQSPSAANSAAPQPAEQALMRVPVVANDLKDLEGRENASARQRPSAQPAQPAPAPIGLSITVNEKGTLEDFDVKSKEPSQVAQAKPSGAKANELGYLAALHSVDQPAKPDSAKPAGNPGNPAQQAQPAREATQLALADQAARGRLDEVRREFEGKQAEVRQLAEQAEGLRKRLVREQTRVDREAYARFYDHPFLNVLPGNELSTFSIDVDTGSYTNVRRFLAQGQLPPPDAVRIEELLNYFAYDDPAPQGDDPFSVNVELAACPWDGGHRLARIGLKGKSVDADKRPTSNLVFLIDTSGSMADINKLPLLKAGMKLLVGQLTENDRVGIVVYSNDTREAFPSTPCHRKAEILAAIDGLRAEGGTNGGAGIQMAYKMAQDNFIKGGTNRVILATDGDFNVGLSKEELLAQSAERAKSGVFLTVLGFGEGNIQEEFMEQLADKGNGQYAYIDSIDEARKVFIHRLSGTLVTIAKDVKIQVEFNPERVASYRLIGYENRAMEARDFRDDKKDAGEIGAGHSVTALYEIVPSGVPAQVAQADRPLKYRRSKGDAAADQAKDAANPEVLTVFLRYKKPDGDKATEISRGVTDDGRDFGRASADLKFSAAVAGFGMLLRGSPYRGTLTYPGVLEVASAALGPDRNGDRKGFLDLVRQAEQIEGINPEPAR